jgi:signal transduction histidine kinase
MRSYRDLPIRTKLQGIIVATSGIALLVASAGLSFYARTALLRAKAQEVYTTTKTLGLNSTAAMTFRDRKAADDILSTLRANGNVILACTYDQGGKVFAKYSRDAPAEDCPIPSVADGKSEIVGGKMALFQKILLGNQSLGEIYLATDLKDLNSEVASFLEIVLLVVVASMAIALALASALQRIISEPIRQLAATALSIDEHQDYSIRAEKHGDDEVGALFVAFNRMLDYIQQRDTELQNAHNNLERRVAERTAHLNALMAENTKMEIDLRHAQKLEAVGALAAGIAHEINTPVQFVSDNTHFLREAFHAIAGVVKKYEKIYDEDVAAGGAHRPSIDDVDAERGRADWRYLQEQIPKALEQAIEGLGRVATIVRAMKDFSHVDHRQMAAADINKAIQSTLIVARNELKYVADVECDYGNLPPVVCSIGDLNQVFLNLLVNAAHAISDVLKATGRRGMIGVRTREENGLVELAISDTGTGIPEEIREKVFDPFFTTKEVGKGTGQGLAIARSIVVVKHGGTLTFDTKLGGGTTFYVRIPTNGVIVNQKTLQVRAGTSK